MKILKTILSTASCFLFSVMCAQTFFQENFNSAYFPVNWTISSKVEKTVALGKNNSGYIRFHPRYQQQYIETPLISLPAGNYVLLFNWNKSGNSNQDSVQVEVSENNGISWQTIYTIYNGNNRTWQTDSVKLENSSENIRLRWKYYSGGIFPSQYFNLDNVVLETDITTYVKQNISEISFSIYPNPNNGIFQIKLNNPTLKNGIIQIMDSKGSVIFQQAAPIVKQSLIQMDKSELSKGIYTILFQTSSDILSKNIIIQ